MTVVDNTLITLKNFRCHQDGVFEIPDLGLVALSGLNGSGKSTIFAGICYALYGKIPGKIKKPYTHGKTTSSVEFKTQISVYSSLLLGLQYRVIELPTTESAIRTHAIHITINPAMFG